MYYFSQQIPAVKFFILFIYHVFFLKNHVEYQVI
jgi:hypothetical protein